MTEPHAPDEHETRTAFTESILDNLSAWTVIALVIGLLYLVWATLAILGTYVGELPSVGA